MRMLAVPVLALLASIAGCASPREHLYTLSGPEPPPVAASPTRYVVLGPVTIPAVVDRPQLIVRQSEVRLVALEQERWAEPLREAVPRVLADAIRTRLPGTSITTRTSRAAARSYLSVAVEITRFEAMAGSEVLIEAHWQLRSDDVGEITGEGGSVARQRVRGGPKDYDALVVAEAAALAEIAAEISHAIEQQGPR